MRSFAIVAILAVLLNACGTNNKYNTNVHGHFPAQSETSISLSYLEVTSSSIIETVMLSKEGNFHFNFQVDEPGFYLLKTSPKNHITLYVEPGDDIKITAESAQINPDYLVNGSKGSSVLQEFEMQNALAREQIDSLMQASQNPLQNRGFEGLDHETQKKYDHIFYSLKSNATSIIDADPASLINLILINKRLGQRPLFDLKADMDYYLLLDSVLIKKYPENPYAISHHERMEQTAVAQQMQQRLNAALAIGQTAPDFSLETSARKEVSLRSLKGKIVVLWFWASYDAPSRQGNKMLVEMYNKHKKQDLEVMAVSLDSYELMWTSAIKADKLNWINVTDLLNNVSPTRQLYNIPDNLPYFYLLDHDQKILMKGRDLSKLESQIDELLSQ